RRSQAGEGEARTIPGSFSRSLVWCFMGTYVGCYSSRFVNSTLPIGRVFQALFLDLREILPDDGAAARIDQLEGIEDVIAGSARIARGQTLELASEEKVRPFELDHVRVAAAGDLAGTFQVAFLFQGRHAVARQKLHLAKRLRV